MSRRRFYAPHEGSGARDAGARLTLSSEESRHLRDVLRLRPGDEAYAFDGEGREYACAVVEVGRGNAGATLEVRARVEPQKPESPLGLALAVALLKGEKFDMVVQKATELGVVRVVPVLTARSDVRPREAAGSARRTARWQRLALEAAKQSGRARVPRLVEPVEFASLVASGPAEGEARLFFSERDGASLAEALPGRPAQPPTATALVGPEGGWESEEIEAARRNGWAVVTLGGRTLRAETAAVVVAALLQHLCGDLR